MLEIKLIKALQDLSELKKHYFEQSTAPLDGMWHFGFVPMATHFGFFEDNILIGYICINSDNYILQFYLSRTAKTQAKELFSSVVKQNTRVIGKIKGAFVSTAEPDYLSLCLDNSTAIKVNALMYQQVAVLDNESAANLSLTLADGSQLPQFVRFAATNIGAPERWLTDYYSNLISREELWGYWKNEKLVASGECRIFDQYQTQYAELGMIVAKSERGQGIATNILKILANLANSKNLAAICSTQNSNLGAQKAIQRAGLVPLNRILQVEFTSK